MLTSDAAANVRHFERNISDCFMLQMSEGELVDMRTADVPMLQTLVQFIVWK